jgi:hypothetical protein
MSFGKSQCPLSDDQGNRADIGGVRRVFSQPTSTTLGTEAI